MRRPRNMTNREKRRAFDLRERGWSQAAIARYLNRDQCTIRYLFNPEAYDRYMERQRVRQRELMGHIAQRHLEPRPCEIPETVETERDRRINAPPRDLTGWCFGDPPKGYSALEQRA